MAEQSGGQSANEKPSGVSKRSDKKAAGKKPKPGRGGKRPAKREPDYSGLPARQAAVALLVSVLREGKSFDESLGRYGTGGPLHGLEQRDRAFARAIATTGLRRHGQIVNVINQFLEKPLPDRCGALREILVAAGAQLLFLDSPAHAVINLAVRQCQLDRRARRFDKLANAVLRKVKDQGPEIVASQNAAGLNTPKWMLERWAHAYGDLAAHRIATANLEEAPLDLTVKSDPRDWADRLGGIVLPTGSVRLVHRGRVEMIEGYEDGEWWVQDAAAALPVQMMGDVRGLRVADLCAAPGGKTAQLIQGGANVVAVDKSTVRLDRLKENLARLNFEAETVESDVLSFRPAEPFDAVLLDAPCSASGTIRRHPDILHLKQQDDLKELVEIQQRLLIHALDLVKPGGVMVYCTCSLEPEEGYMQVVNLLNSLEGFEVEPIGPHITGGLGDVIESGALRTFPFHMESADPALSGMDGFFAVLIRKG